MCLCLNMFYKIITYLMENIILNDNVYKSISNHASISFIIKMILNNQVRI